MSGPDQRSFAAGSWPRVRSVAKQTFAEALRLRLTWLLSAAAGLLVLMALWLRTLNFGEAELRFIADFGLGAIGLMGMLLGVLATAHLFFSDISGAVIGCVLTRTVRRWEYLAGKLGGVMVLLAVFVGVLSGVLAIVIALREAELNTTFVPLTLFLQACVLVWLKASLVAAMTLLVCSYAGSALFASCAGLMLAMIAHLRPFAEAKGATAWLRLWPNLGLFSVEPLLSGVAVGFAGIALYWVIFMAVLLGLSSYVFKQREF